MIFESCRRTASRNVKNSGIVAHRPRVQPGRASVIVGFHYWIALRRSRNGSCSHGLHVLLDRIRLEADALHVRADLFRNFFEHLLCQVSHAHALVELYELNDVAGALLPSRVAQLTVVAIELLHRREVRIADTDYDNRAGQL